MALRFQWIVCQISFLMGRGGGGGGGGGGREPGLFVHHLDHRPVLVLVEVDEVRPPEGGREQGQQPRHQPVTLYNNNNFMS